MADKSFVFLIIRSPINRDGYATFNINVDGKGVYNAYL